MNSKRAFYIGRFQPYHLGHHTVLEIIAEEVDEIVVGIGSAQRSHETKNPFTAGERMLMISRALNHLEKPFYVVPIEDIQRNSVWVSHVMSMVPPFQVAYSNNPFVARLFREAGVEVQHSPMFQREEYSGTEIRRRMLEDEPWEDLVPPDVVQIIKEINGIDRLKKVSETDKH